MLTKEKKAYFEKLLSQRLGEVFEAANEIAGGMKTSAGQSPDPVDRACTEAQTSFALRVRERETVLTRKIEYALSKLEDGTFGICEECGEEISEKRLQARPVATLCIECKEKEETAERGEEGRSI
jgi:DnaK suppressor protein